MSLTMEELLRCEVATLKDELESVKRERDFLLKYMMESKRAYCDICKHDADGSGAMGCAHLDEIGIPCFEWRGLPEV